MLSVPPERSISPPEPPTDRVEWARSWYDRDLTVYHAVDDLGADPTGTEPIDDLVPVEDDTIVVFPDGRFSTGPHVYTGEHAVGYYGWTAEQGSSPTLVPRAPATDGSGAWFHQDGGPYLLDGLTFDFREPGRGGSIALDASRGGCLCRDVWVRGSQAEPTSAVLRVGTRDPDADCLVENVVAAEGMEADNQACMGIFVPRSHAGTLYIRGCRVERFNNNGLYASGPGDELAGNGIVHVSGGSFRNNNIANVRLGSAGSSIRGTTIEVDRPTDFGAGRIPSNARGIWLRNADRMIVEDVSVRFSGGRASGAIVESQGAGRSLVRDTRVTVDDADVVAPVLRRASGSSRGSIYRNLRIDGGVDNGHLLSRGTAVLIERADGSRFRGCCIEQTASERDGIVIVDSAGSTVADSTIDVTGRPTVAANADVRTWNLAYDGDCLDSSGPNEG